MLLLLSLCFPPQQRFVDAAPNYWACTTPEEQAYLHCNTSFSHEQRLQHLLDLLTLPEKIQLLSPDPSERLCSTHTPEIPHKLPPYMWLVEVNTVVKAACISPHQCSTQFSGPLTMGASFNRTLWRLKGRVLGTEQRAYVNIGWKRRDVNSTDLIGLTAFGPNINQPRDPRNGRTSELVGEDPYATGQYAIHMLQGLQTLDPHQGSPLVLAYLKHFVAYSREANRGGDDYQISLYDLHDTYLPAFLHAAPYATGVMCSYNAVHGRPMCANAKLLHVLKQVNPDLHVTTDCGAVSDLRRSPAYAPDALTAAVWALRNGSDLEMGSTYYGNHLREAVEELGLVTEEEIDGAVQRGYLPHFSVGRFDPWEESEWSKFNLSDVNSTYHQRVAHEGALQGLVLLKNEGHVLPLDYRTTRVAVVGPLGVTRAGLMSDYENDESCFGGGAQGGGRGGVL